MNMNTNFQIWFEIDAWIRRKYINNTKNSGLSIIHIILLVGNYGYEDPNVTKIIIIYRKITIWYALYSVALNSVDIQKIK